MEQRLQFEKMPHCPFKFWAIILFNSQFILLLQSWNFCKKNGPKEKYCALVKAGVFVFNCSTTTTITYCDNRGKKDNQLCVSGNNGELFLKLRCALDIHLNFWMRKKSLQCNGYILRYTWF